MVRNGKEIFFKKIGKSVYTGTEGIAPYLINQ